WGVKEFSPSKYLSKGEFAEMRVLSNWAIAFAVNSLVILLVPKALLKSSGYTLVLCRLVTAFSQVLCISMGFVTGSSDCFSMLVARPSQKNLLLVFHAILKSGIELRVPSKPSIPILNCASSVKALLGLWRSEEHTSELQSRENLVCRLLLE